MITKEKTNFSSFRIKKKNSVSVNCIQSYMKRKYFPLFNSNQIEGFLSDMKKKRLTYIHFNFRIVCMIY